MGITCLQIAMIVRLKRPEVGGRLSMSDRGIPPLTGINGTLMARRSCPVRHSRTSPPAEHHQPQACQDLRGHPGAGVPPPEASGPPAASPPLRTHTRPDRALGAVQAAGLGPV